LKQLAGRAMPPANAKSNEIIIHSFHKDKFPKRYRTSLSFLFTASYFVPLPIALRGRYNLIFGIALERLPNILDVSGDFIDMVHYTQSIFKYPLRVYELPY